MSKTISEMALDIAHIIEDGKGQDVCVIDISELNSWTDFFVIATVTSSSQWQGIYREIKDYIKDTILEIHKTDHKTSQGDEWNLVDLGAIVVHLMSEEARKFYDLETLWQAGKKLK